ncbi:MAG: DUF1624 domain-containing protein [Planctomycetaceae bacterium]|nr:DUF1624 domain-containing protein [Planctomycetaceae bacterium]
MRLHLFEIVNEPMTGTYRLAQENANQREDSIPPALSASRSSYASPLSESEDDGKSSRGTYLRRVDSIDLFRGSLLVVLILGTAYLSSPMRSSLPIQGQNLATWISRLEFNTAPSEWVSLYAGGIVRVRDLVLSGFLFVSGLSLFFWKRRRSRMDDHPVSRVGRILKRTFVLIVLGIFLQSLHSEYTRWVLTDALTIIGISWFLTYILARGPKWFQLVMVALLLTCYAVWFESSAPVRYPDELAAIPVNPDPENAWAYQANVADLTDRIWMSRLPNQPDAEFRLIGRTSFVFIPATALMLFGYLCASILSDSSWSRWPKFIGLCGAAAALILAGFGAHVYLGPAIEKLMSPAWVLLAAGYALAWFAVCYLVCEVCRCSALVTPLRQMGRNSLLIALTSLSLTGWLGRELWKHLHPLAERLAGGTISSEFTLLCHMVMAVLAAMLIAEILDRQRIHIRL